MMCVNSASGGGGERVLWVGVPALFASCPEIKHIVIYAGDEGMSKSDILTHVKVRNVPLCTCLRVCTNIQTIAHVPSVCLQNRFGIGFTAEQEQRLSFVFIKSRTLLEAKW